MFDVFDASLRARFQEMGKVRTRRASESDPGRGCVYFIFLFCLVLPIGSGLKSDSSEGKKNRKKKIPKNS